MNPHRELMNPKRELWYFKCEGLDSLVDYEKHELKQRVYKTRVLNFSQVGWVFATQHCCRFCWVNDKAVSQVGWVASFRNPTLLPIVLG